MLLRWKRIATTEISYNHPVLPPAQINTYHPLEFSNYYLINRPYLSSAAVLALKHPNPMLHYFWSETHLAEMAAFVIKQEDFNPLQTIFVFDCGLFKTDFRQIVFEWREHSPTKNENEVKWTAHQVLAKIRFNRRFLKDFCEADENLFKMLRERQNKVYEDNVKRKSSKAKSLFLLLISNPAVDEVFDFENVCHLAIEIDAAKPGENYRPALLAICGATDNYQQKAGKADKLLRALRNNLIDTHRFLNQGTILCQKCEKIGKFPRSRQQKHISLILQNAA